MNPNIIFVTGFFGAPLMQRAQQLAEKHGCSLLHLDEEIAKADGRSVRRICMMMGEHEYRNKEYEAVKKIVEKVEQDAEGTDRAEAARSGTAEASFVVCCGDGVLHDDDARNLICQYAVEIVGADMTEEELWNGALEDKDTYHAFMHFGDEATKREKFSELIQRQRQLFKGID